MKRERRQPTSYQAPTAAGLVAVLLLLLVSSASCLNQGTVGIPPSDGEEPDHLDPGASDLPGPDASDDRGADGTELPFDLPQETADLVTPDGDQVDTMQDSADLEPAEIEIALEITPQWQRGAVTLRYSIEAPTSDELTVQVEYSLDGTSYSAATPLAGFPDGTGPLLPGLRRFVWDSLADIQSDQEQVVVRLRGVRSAQVGEWVVAGPFGVMNRPDRDRVVLLTSSINGNDKVRRLVFSHTQGLSYTNEVYSVGFPAERVRFEPGGRSAVVFGESADRLLFLSFDPDGTVTGQITVETEETAFGQAEFLPDSSALLLLDVNATEHGGGLYYLACDPWTGLPEEQAVPELIYPVYAASSLALLPGLQGAVLVGTSQGDPRGDLHLQVISLEGSRLSEVVFAPADSMEEAVAVSPDGRHILVAHMNWSGSGQVVLFGLDEEGHIQLPEGTNYLEIGYPDHLAFHPGSTSALLSQYDPDRVISLIWSADGSLWAASSHTLGLPGAIAHPEIGPDRGLYFVTTVNPSSSELGSGLGIFELASDGTVTPKEPFYLGGGSDRIPSGLAIQP
ncbi:MAG: hypothetical protein JW797_08250 [Bradymonadales bacterium]|nr:hypothetical protein [Bradymonadales bacterium]